MLPIRIQFYLDDFLIQSRSERLAHQDLATTIQVLEAHGFSVNLRKSHLELTMRIQHLGDIIDTIESKIYFSLDRLSSLRPLVRSVTSGDCVPLLSLSQLLGKMVSCIGIVPWSWLNCRALQWFLLPYQEHHLSSSHRAVLSAKVTQSLLWWVSLSYHHGEGIQGN